MAADMDDETSRPLPVSALLEGREDGELDHAEMAATLELWGPGIWNRVRKQQAELGIDPTDALWRGLQEGPGELVDLLARCTHPETVEGYIALCRQGADHHRRLADEQVITDAEAEFRPSAETETYSPVDLDSRLEDLIDRWGCRPE